MYAHIYEMNICSSSLLVVLHRRLRTYNSPLSLSLSLSLSFNSMQSHIHTGSVYVTTLYIHTGSRSRFETPYWTSIDDRNSIHTSPTPSTHRGDPSRSAQ